MNPTLQKRIQRYGWNKAASCYESLWEQQLKPAQNMLLELAGLEPGHSVVDIACGTGLVTLKAARMVAPGGCIIGTDISDDMIALARHKAKEEKIDNVIFLRQGAEEYSFPASLCALGLMYVVDPRACLELIKKTIKPGGRIVSAVWGARKHCGWAGVFPIVDAKVKTDACPMFFHLGTETVLADLYTQASLTDVAVEKIMASLNYETANDAIDAMFIGGPVALAYSRFSPETKELCHQEYLESIKPFRKGTGYEIPGEFVMVSGKR